MDNCRAIKVQGNAQRSGEPDIDGCYRGRSLKLEVKRPQGTYKPSELQLAVLSMWKEAGALTGVVHSVDEVKALLEEAERGDKCET